MKLQKFRIERLKKYANKYKVELLIASSSPNISYVTGGYYSVAGAEIYLAFDVKTEQTYYFASIAEIPGILEHDPNAMIVPYGTFQFPVSKGSLYEKVEELASNRYETAVDALIGFISNKYTKIALDETLFSFKKYDYLLKGMPNLKVIGGNKIFQLARKIKHEEEINGIRKSVEIAENSFLRALDRFTIGDTELDLERYYTMELAKNGAKPCFFVATSNERAAFVDAANKNKEIKEGSIIRFDFGCMYNHYSSDIARTIFVGKVDKEWEEKYKVIRDAQEVGLNMLKPNVNVKDIFLTVVNYVQKNGIPDFRRNHIGHGIGLEAYDIPTISGFDESNIQKDMCINIEVPYYELGRGGLQIENTTLITDSGFEFLDSGNLEAIRL